MNVLAIESSCDETSAAVVSDGRVVRSNIVASQVDLHARYGGVVPEVASRQHLAQVLRHHAGDSVPKRALLKIRGNPCAFRAPEDCLHIRLFRLQGPVVKVRRIVHVAGAPSGVKFHVEHALADDAPLACARRRGVLQRMLQVEQQPGHVAGVVFVYQHRSPAKQIPVTLKD